MATLMDVLFAIQRWIHSSLTADLSAFAQTRDITALAAMIPFGVLFGAVHALTPGHGKTVLASYLIGSRLATLRSLAIAGVLALTHVASAVILALAASTLITRTLGGAGRAPLLEDVSRGLLAAIGLWLLWCAWKGRSHVHGEGLFVGLVAGLVPCPLTLFAMVAALAHGVPGAGLTFAVAMAGGVALTLGTVAVITVVCRERVLAAMSRSGLAVQRISRSLDAVAGSLLLLIGARELLL